MMVINVLNLFEAHTCKITSKMFLFLFLQHLEYKCIHAADSPDQEM